MIHRVYNMIMVHAEFFSRLDGDPNNKNINTVLYGYLTAVLVHKEHAPKIIVVL